MAFKIRRKIPKMTGAGPIGGLNLNTLMPSQINPVDINSLMQDPNLSLMDQSYQPFSWFQPIGLDDEVNSDNLLGKNNQTFIGGWQPKDISFENGNDVYQRALDGEDFKTGNEKDVETGNEENGVTSTSPSMQMPYFAPDILSRVKMVGSGIGNFKSFNKVLDDLGPKSTWGEDEKRTAGLAKAGRAAALTGSILSGISAVAGAVREGMSAASEQNAKMKDLESYREELRKSRVNSNIQYTEKGGGVNIGNGDVVDTSSMTGEYMYPLPKSMEKMATVEVEKGEYVMTPDIVQPMEVLGERHTNGGTKIGITEGFVLSDAKSMQIGKDRAMEVRDVYGVNANPTDTPATLVDKKKKKIGLKRLYEQEEKILKKIEEADKVKDENTKLLNKSHLSGELSEIQQEKEALEQELRDFAEAVYRMQEADKRKRKMDKFFQEGGVIDTVKLRKTAKALGVDENKAKDWIYGEYVKMRGGGYTEKRKNEYERVKKANISKLMNDLFGRQLMMRIVDVKDRDKIFTGDVNSERGHQGASSYGYGNVNADSKANLGDLNRWGNQYLVDDDIEGFQEGYNDQLVMLEALVDNGIIKNAEDAKKFVYNYGFWGENGLEKYGNYIPETTYSAGSIDDKFGEYTATRSFYSLDVLNDRQKQELNNAGIKNYSDLFGDKKDKAKKILGSDYEKFKKMKDAGVNNDFVLESYIPSEELKAETPRVPVSEPVKPQVVDTTSVNNNGNGNVGAGNYTDPRDKNVKNRSYSGYTGMGAIFPEVLRAPQSGIIGEGLERHIAPHIDPVLASPDAFMSEYNRQTQAHLDSLSGIPDSQRAAILSNLNAMAATNVAKFINDTEAKNAQQRNYANSFNTNAYSQTDDKNIIERQKYESGLLKAMSVSDENYARYLDSLNDEFQKKFNVQTSLNTIKSIAPDMAMLPNGQIIYSPGGRDVINAGDFSTRILKALEEEKVKEKTKKNK